MQSANDRGTSKAPPNSLLAAAAAGFLSVTIAAGCSSGKEPSADDALSPGGTSGSGGLGGQTSQEEVYFRVLRTDATDEDLVALCDEREGWLYRTAFCAGSGHCKGLFLLEGTLVEYSCRGMNSCGGTGCVDLPEDRGRSGQEIYEKGGCANCHGQWTEDYSDVDLSYFRVLHPNSMAPEDKLEEFAASPIERLVSILIFGTQGVYANGEAFSNMPSYRERYSRDELRRTAEHIRGLKLVAASYEVPGGTSGSSGSGH